MAELASGAVAAVVASALFSVGLVLQATEARTVRRDRAHGLALLAHLLRRPRWVLGGATMVVGFAFHVGALTMAPLSVVQPALAAGLLVLLAYGVRSGAERIGARELAGVVAITAGVVGVTLTASERTALSAGTLALGLALGGLGALALVPQAGALRGLRDGLPVGLLAAFGAGAAYSLTGVTTKLLSDRVEAAEWVSAALWLGATALAAALALIDQTTALQRRGATQVGVVIYVMPVVVPVLLAPLLLGEGWDASPAGPLPLALSVAVVCLGAAALASSPQVSAVDHPPVLP